MWLLEFIMRNAQLAEKTNITRLIHGMVIKLNDPKEIVRIEIESFFTALAQVGTLFHP
jgi:DNA-binding transcriptional regulator LsrR (DeoR family)